MERTFRDVVHEAVTGGDRTVLLSSHILAEVERLGDRVSIIRHGRIVEEGTLAELRHLTRTSIDVRTRTPLADLADREGVHELDRDGTHARFEVDPEHLDATLRHVTAHGVEALTSTPPTLEELFLRHYADDAPLGSSADREVRV